MLLAVFLILCGAVLPVQLWLCFCSKRRSLQMLPALMLIIYTGGCALAAAFPEAFSMQPDGQLAVLIAMLAGLFCLAADILAWLLWGIIHFVQKRRKRFVM